MQSPWHGLILLWWFSTLEPLSSPDIRVVGTRWIEMILCFIWEGAFVYWYLSMEPKLSSCFSSGSCSPQHQMLCLCPGKRSSASMLFFLRDYEALTMTRGRAVSANNRIIFKGQFYWSLKDCFLGARQGTPQFQSWGHMACRKPGWAHTTHGRLLGTSQHRQLLYIHGSGVEESCRICLGSLFGLKEKYQVEKHK